MMMLRLFGLCRKPLSEQLKRKLPPVNSFVDLAMTARGPRGSVCVETVDDRAVAVTLLPGIAPGLIGVFNYQNALGRFRFSTKCQTVSGQQALFASPDRVETVQIFSPERQRAAVRLDATVPGGWRYAPAGKGTGDYTRASLTDISRSGASLIVDRDVKKGTYVEVRFAVSTSATPLVILGEVMRSEKLESSRKMSLGLRFHGLKPDEDRAIMEFINKRQAERRNRGLA
jgi:hypothetical protein